MRLGSDPEVFLINQAGLHVSAIGFINASKWDPLQIPDMEKGFTLQEDNVSLEYGIPPASTAKEFAAHITAVMEKSREYFPNNLTFSKLSCTIFDRSQMLNPRAHVFGCEPDFNAWTKSENKSPSPPHMFMRSAGGHVHIETKEDPIAVIRAMDLFAGVPSVLMDEGVERRQMYGSAGAHRVKSYGVEYRTLSNFWIFEEHYKEWVWRAAERALTNLNVADQYESLILDSINNNNKSAAEFLCKELSLEVV